MKVNQEIYGCGWGAEMHEKTYIEQKVAVMKELGVNDSEKLAHYLKERTKDATSESKREIQVDNICRKIINDYYEGDRTFCKGYTKKAR